MNKRIFAARVRGTAVFFAVIPAATIAAGLLMDHWLGWSFHAGPARYVITTLLLALGGVLITWAAYDLVHYGEGTPSPKAPPERIVTQGPYRYTRHPIFLGYLICAGGVAIALQSPGMLLVALPLLVAGSVFYLRWEERVLVTRFGSAYEDYQARTSFLLPFPFQRPPRSD